MKNPIRIKLKTKILSLVTLLIIGVVEAFSAQIIHSKLKDDVAQSKQLALQNAQTLSYMTILQESFREDGDISGIVTLAEDMLYKLKPMIIFFLNKDGFIYASTDEKKVYEGLQVKDSDKALTYGSFYVRQTEESGQEVLKAIAPVFVDYGDYKKIEGTVVVLYEMDLIYNEVWEDIKTILMSSAIILLIALIGSYYLANSIRKDTLNLEPYEIAAIFRERNAVLESAKEGIIAVDDKGVITMMNASASQMFGVAKKIEGQKLSEVIKSAELLKLLESHEKQENIEIHDN